MKEIRTYPPLAAEAQVTRTWTSDGSINTMSIHAAAENLRQRMTAESWDVVLSYGERNVESIKAALLAGDVLETTWADFRIEDHGHA